MTTIALIPADRHRLAELAGKYAPGVEIPIPGTDHSLTTCDRCSDSCWIGPGQAEMRSNPFIRTEAVCYLCLVNYNLLPLRSEDLIVARPHVKWQNRW